MGNLRCPLCGENFSDTYKACPFCEEDRAFDMGKPLHRTGKKRLSKRRRSGGAAGVLTITALVVAALLVGKHFLGEIVGNYLGIRQIEEQASEYINQVETTDPIKTGEDENATPEPLRLGTDSVAVSVGDTAILTASGGQSPLAWSSSDETIATVADGVITGVSGGTATITVTAGEESLTCQVQVIGQAAVNTAKLSLSHEDVTLRKNDPAFQIKVKGDYVGTVVWASSNNSVAKVTDNGTVSYAGTGRATVTATVDGQTLSCIIRCP